MTLYERPGDREVVDVAAAQRGAQRGADVLLRQPERRDMSRSTATVVCGLSSFRSVSTKKNMPLAWALCSTACATRSGSERLRRLDDELQRQALRARQRRKLERRDARAGDADSISAAAPAAAASASCAALFPRLEQHAADALVERGRAGDLEHLVIFGQRLGDRRTPASRRRLICCDVALGGPWICDSTTPWSSCGASSDFDVMNR